ncbi:MAG: Bacteriophage CI repressor helix-turn-helix domain protein [Syntrophorhabdus sp. PtaU1.Bin153]|nr:MAG: Bacteriophage CI repressor helix-turn-helix domain protein [Syntrophorhabdus sp. PtaU1.Bin153]
MRTKLDDPSIIDVATILKRVQHFAGITNDRDLAGLFGVKPVTVASWKTRNLMPLELIVQFAVKRGLSLDMLITGETPWVIPPLAYFDYDYEFMGMSEEEECFQPSYESEVRHVDILESGIYPPSWCLQFAVEYGPDAAKYETFLASDDKMSPTISKGDLVLVYPEPKISKPGMYAVVHDIATVSFPHVLIKPKGKVQLDYDNSDTLIENISDLRVHGSVQGILKILT